MRRLKRVGRQLHTYQQCTRDVGGGNGDADLYMPRTVGRNGTYATEYRYGSMRWERVLAESAAEADE